MNRFRSWLTITGLTLAAVFAGSGTAVLADLERRQSTEQPATLRKLLKDPAAGVRLRAAMALAEAQDADAIPVLIDLLADLDAAKRQPVEEFLVQLAGEWAPVVNFPADDKIAR